MADSENTFEFVEEKLDLVRRYLQQTLNALVAKEKKLQEAQESVVRSSEKLNLFQEYTQELLEKAAEEENLSHFLMVEKGFEELEMKGTKLDLIQMDVMIRLEKLNEEEKLMKVLLGKVECMGRQLEAIKKLGYHGFRALCLQESQAEDCVRKLKLIEGQEVQSSKQLLDDEKGENLKRIVKEIEMRGRVLDLKRAELVAIEKQLDQREKIFSLRLKGIVAKQKIIEVREKILGSRKEGITFNRNEIEMKDKSLGLNQEQIEYEDNVLETREKILELRLEENVAKGNELEAREKILKLWKELDLKRAEVKSVPRSKEQCSNEPNSTNTIPSGKEMGQKSRKRECMEMNGNCGSLKRCRLVEEIFCCREDNLVEETIAYDLNELGSAHSGNSDSRCDRNGPGSANPGFGSALVYSELIPDHKEFDSNSTALSLGLGSDSAAGDTSSLYAYENQVKLEEISELGNDAEQIHGHDVGKAYTHSTDISDSRPTVYSNLLITDFDKDKLKSLSAGQTWASYSEDDFPRSYFRVLKVLHKPRRSGLVRLRIVWLQPLPNYIAWKKVWKELKYVNLPIHWNEWIDTGLPVGSGVFKCGKEQTLSLSLDSLSGRLCCKNKNSPYLVHPGKGETWAIYNNWDIVRWTSNPENHKHCKFDIVEILGRNPNGFRVAKLDKVGGFVSLFQRSSQSSFLIEDQELFRFSHKVPSFRMTGTERQGVPKGSFELDPKDLPADFVEVGNIQA